MSDHIFPVLTDRVLARMSGTIAAMLQPGEQVTAIEFQLTIMQGPQGPSPAMMLFLSMKNRVIIGGDDVTALHVTAGEVAETTSNRIIDKNCGLLVDRIRAQHRELLQPRG